MGDTSAWAAWAAAATSLATLIVTTVVGGRREQHRWAREALADAFVAFLEASWAHCDVVRSLPAQAGTESAPALALYQEMRSQLTRLRLLTSEEVLRTGEELLRCQRRVHDAPPGPERTAAMTDASALRRSVVDAAKKEMGL
ncbi:hypothetical protein JHN59_03515 [Streptomyces sp. MBT49]|uniref:hypothetical protein n=1 Tax=Streptomyces sp. MBT49 TaxID=1488380 RepID=UPI00190A03CF|nr:hypothetical protein [Streptomyces sp. MBT49]MBK3623918.1 hypothetical protein [Streptomyces sp. MBT49]